jgi:phage terminase small subunit
MSTLTDKQARFVAEYLTDYNATQAAIRAGYTPRSARQTAARLLTKANIASEVERKHSKIVDKLEVTKERVVQELARIAFSDVRRLFTWDERKSAFVPSKELTDDDAAAISEINSETVVTRDKAGSPRATIKLKMKTYDKKGALDSLAKHLGMFVDKVEHAGADGGPLEVIVTRRIVNP